MVTTFDAGLRPTLSAFLDTLIPDDDIGPGAIALSIDGKFLAAAARGRDRPFLMAGLEWLDDRARQLGAASFAALEEAKRRGIVAEAAAAAAGTMQHRFFRSARYAVFYHYYADPRAGAAIGYDGPPQPLGFMDYAAAPKAQP